MDGTPNPAGPRRPPPPHFSRPAGARPTAPGALGARWFAKRGLDVLGAGVGLTLLAPAFALIASAILLTSGGPIFYLQDRVGRGGIRFRIWKFRSMRTDAESQTGPVWAETNDARCTGVGVFLRKTNLDELPQLWNVLRGEMSLVGPRPERPVFVERFRAEWPDYDRRHEVPVGMTGWAQVHGWRGRTSLEMRLRYDLDYVQRWSIRLDLAILAMTIAHVVWGKTRWKTPRLAPRGRPRDEAEFATPSTETTTG